MYNRYLDDSEFVLLDPEPQSGAPVRQAQDRDRSHPHGQSRPNQPHPGQNRPSLMAQPRPMGQSPSKNDLVGEITGGLGSLLGGLDPNMLSAAAGLLGQFNGGDDDRRVALLTALRPFVKEQRYARLDKAIQIARLSRLIRSGLDLFRAKKDGPQGENSHREDSPREGGGHV